MPGAESGAGGGSSDVEDGAGGRSSTRDGGSRDDEGGAGTDDSDGMSAAEQAVMAASVGFTVALFGVALWYAFTGPGAVTPAVTVLDSQQSPGGDVVFTVELRNPGDVGLVSVTVSAECTDPPTELTFENVPATARRTGRVVCPPGTSDPSVSVSSWVTE